MSGEMSSLTPALGGLASPQGTTWVPGGERDGARTSLDLSLFPSHTEVLEGEYGWSRRAGAGGGGERGPDGSSLPDFLASLCSLRTEMERIHQEQSKVRQSKARQDDGQGWQSGGDPNQPLCPLSASGSLGAATRVRPHRRGQSGLV